MKPKSKYFGITHDVPMDKLEEWRLANCSRNVHAFDEVWSIEGHHLSCDACELSVEIAEIDTKWMDQKSPLLQKK